MLLVVPWSLASRFPRCVSRIVDLELLYDASPKNADICIGAQFSIKSRIFLARSSIPNGFVSTAMPGSRWPLPTAAFSA